MRTWRAGLVSKQNGWALLLWGWASYNLLVSTTPCPKNKSGTCQAWGWTCKWKIRCRCHGDLQASEKTNRGTIFSQWQLEMFNVQVEQDQSSLDLDTTGNPAIFATWLPGCWRWHWVGQGDCEHFEASLGPQFTNELNKIRETAPWPRPKAEGGKRKEGQGGQESPGRARRGRAGSGWKWGSTHGGTVPVPMPLHILRAHLYPHVYVYLEDSVPQNPIWFLLSIFPNERYLQCSMNQGPLIQIYIYISFYKLRGYPKIVWEASSKANGHIFNWFGIQN